jgi:DNA-binding IclR family transcriptional regulator
VLDKVALLVDCLADHPDTTAPKLAELVGLPRSTVYRLVAALEGCGWVEAHREAGTYRLGVKLLRLGRAVRESFDERAAALPVMREINRATDETVTLCLRRGREAVCIERIDGNRVQSLDLRIGGSLPLHAGAAPRCLLAWAPRTEWAAYARGGLETLTPRTLATWEVLRADLERVRERGYAISDEDVTPGIASVGAPIFSHSGRIAAAVSVGGLASVVLGPHADHIRQLVVDGAARISAALGYDPDNPRNLPADG